MRDPRQKKLFLLYRERGDVQALGELFDVLSPELLVVARHVSGDRAEAEDLVQAAFLTALEHPERYDESRPLAAWFVGVLTKEAQAWRRKAIRRPDGERAMEPRLASEQRARPDRAAVDAESAGLIAGAMAKLPDLYRAVLEPHLLAGLSPQSIAQDQGRSPATVRVQLHRGMARLRELLPAGVAGGLALTLTERGMAQVRREVTAHAATLVPSIAAKAGGVVIALKIGSILMTQRIVLAGLAIIVIVSAGYFGRETLWPQGASTGAGLTGGSLATLPEDIVLVSIDDAVRAGDGSEPEAAMPESEVDAFGSLLVSTVWNDGSPAVNVAFDYLLFRKDGETQRGQTDRTGSVLIEGLTAGTYGIYGDRSGHARVHMESTHTAPGAPAQRVTLRLAKGVDVNGRVVDADGVGVGHAELWVSNGMNRDKGAVVARCAADGSFLLRQLPDECFFGARKEGYAASNPQHVGTFVDQKSMAGSTEATFVLQRSRVALGGVVLDPDGSPVAGARVRVGKQSGFGTMGPDGPAGPPPPQEIMTDENGEFRCAGLLPGQVAYACKANGFAVSTGRVSVSASEATQVTIELVQGAWLRGTIRSPGGAPAENIILYANERALDYPKAVSSFGRLKAETDGEGAFAIGPLAPGEVGIEAASYDGKQRANRTIEAVDGGSYRWELKLQGLPTISGIAVDESGKPLVGWSVVARPERRLSYPSRAAVCAADGSFEVHLTETIKHRLELHAPGSGSTSELGYFLRGAPRSWKDNVEVGALGVRLILDSDQAPLASFSGGLESRGTLGKTRITVIHDRLGELVEYQVAPRTASFEIGELPAGDFMLKIESQDCATLWVRELRLERGQHKDLGTLIVQAGGDLQVDLKSQGDLAIGSVWAELFDSQNNSCYVTQQGTRVEARALPPGDYILKVQATGFGSARFELTIVAGQRTEVQLPLAPGGSIGFVLLDADGKSLDLATRLIVTGGQGRKLFEGDIDADRHSHWMSAPYGKLKVKATCEDGRSIETTIQFDPITGPQEAHVLRLR